MLKLIHIDIAKSEELSFVERVYTDSFPKSERRPLLLMIDLYKSDERFTIQVIYKGNALIGFLTYWVFDRFVFAEHFAIIAEARNGGVGGGVMTLFMKEQTKPIVLEVELPATILAERRIGFYQRLGYKLWMDIPYQQPPYEAGGSPIPMYFMTYGALDMNKDFLAVKDCLYSEVYGY